MDGLRYRDLPEDLVEQFDTYQLDCVILHGYEPSDEEIEKIPQEKISFEIEEIDWTWEWVDSSEKRFMDI